MLVRTNLTAVAQPSPDEATSSIWLLGALAQAVSSLGGDPERVLGGLALDDERLADARARIPSSVVASAWEQAATETGDDHFGLHFAERAPFGAFDVVDYAIRSAPTFGEAILRRLRYQRLLQDCVVVELQLTADTARLVHRAEGCLRSAPRHAVEAALACFVVRGRHLTGVEFSPRQVTFLHPAPHSLEEHQRILRCPIRFDAAENALVLDRALLSLPNRTADPGLLAVLDRYAEEMLVALPPMESFLSRVRRLVANDLVGRPPPLATVARRLHMSPRTLQRRLGAAGTSFQALADEVRFDHALDLLADRRLPLAEIAFKLGFSGASAFHRAFRKWTGTTPLRHRASLSAERDLQNAPGIFAERAKDAAASRLQGAM
ncbi:MAG TPA: AraC family transcriptional regulator [Myxococcaceae bacterium]|nr:AraC family transcriptional regulator [Myxococcaceae bacterium]